MVGDISAGGSAGYRTDVVGSRAVAQVVDWIVAIVVTFGVALLLLETGVQPTRGAFGLIAGTSAFLYNALLEGFWGGQTVGKRLVGIRVRGQRGSDVSVGQAFIRNIPAIVSPGLLLYLVALLSIAMDDKKRRVFDHAAGTIVVRGS
ncbi:hypothetical protein GCM10028857_29370 [Salinarchaeum chitinilyticum]